MYKVTKLNQMKRLLTLLMAVAMLSVSLPTYAQSNSSNFNSTRRSLATVMFAGLGGAVLGLSTLSFYGKPEEHINNIWTGLALGVIGGAIYVSVDTSQGSHYSLRPELQVLPQNPNQLQAATHSAFSWQFDF